MIFKRYMEFVHSPGENHRPHNHVRYLNIPKYRDAYRIFQATGAYNENEILYTHYQDIDLSYSFDGFTRLGRLGLQSLNFADVETLVWVQISDIRLQSGEAAEVARLETLTDIWGNILDRAALQAGVKACIHLKLRHENFFRINAGEADEYGIFRWFPVENLIQIPV